MVDRGFWIVFVLVILGLTETFERNVGRGMNRRRGPSRRRKTYVGGAVESDEHHDLSDIGVLTGLIKSLNMTDNLSPPPRYQSDATNLPDISKRAVTYDRIACEKLHAAKLSRTEGNPTKALSEATQGLKAFFTAVEQAHVSMINNQTLAGLLCERGTAYAAHGEWGLALADFSNAMKVSHVKMNQAYFGCGMAYSAVGRKDKAIGVWNDLLKLPDTDYHRQALYWIKKESKPQLLPVEELKLVAAARTRVANSIESKNWTEALGYLGATLSACEALIKRLPADQVGEARAIQYHLEILRQQINDEISLRGLSSGSNLSSALVAGTKAIATGSFLDPSQYFSASTTHVYDRLRSDDRTRGRGKHDQSIEPDFLT